MKTSRLPHNSLLVITLVLPLLLTASPVSADVVVVAGAQSRTNQLSREDVINIFMGGYRQLPDGTAAQPIDQWQDSPIRRTFYRHLLDKSLEEINAYWARLVFSGRTLPPATAKNQTDLLDRLSKDPRAISYLDQQQLPRPENDGTGRDLKIKILYVLRE
jgi:hypothetical protein